MAKGYVCDVCRKTTNRLVFKLFLAPKNGRSTHSDYGAHADVGECCGSRVLSPEFVNWQKRVKSSSPRKKRQQHAKP